MIRKIFLTERKEFALVLCAGLALCLFAAVGFSLAGIGATDAVRANHGETVFAVLNCFSYLIPLVYLAMAVFSFRTYYRIAGVPEEKIIQGVIFNLFVWTTIALVAQMLFATLFDVLYFAGRDAVRGQANPQCMMLSLREHGAFRLLFAPSVAVTVTLLYVSYDLIRVAVRRPRPFLLKLTIGALLVIFLFLYHSMVYCAAVIPGTLADASWLVPPDSVLPISLYLVGETPDFVKNTHALSAPLLNAVYLAGELVYCLFVFGFVRAIGRCDHEIDAA